MFEGDQKQSVGVESTVSVHIMYTYYVKQDNA